MSTDHNQYKVLPFGLSTAHCVFSKILAVVAAYLRTQDVLIFPHLDDHLLKSPFATDSLHSIHLTMDLFTNLSLCVNLEKSTLVVVQSLEFIRAQLDAVEARAFLPAHRFSTIVYMVRACPPNLCQDISPATQPYGRGHVHGKVHTVTHVISSGMAMHSIHTSQIQPAQIPIHAKEGQGLTTLVDTAQGHLCRGFLSFNPG